MRALRCGALMGARVAPRLSLSARCLHARNDGAPGQETSWSGEASLGASELQTTQPAHQLSEPSSDLTSTFGATASAIEAEEGGLAGAVEASSKTWAPGASQSSSVPPEEGEQLASKKKGGVKGPHTVGIFQRRESGGEIEVLMSAPARCVGCGGGGGSSSSQQPMSPVPLFVCASTHWHHLP
jgi:hypothetical protein